MNITSDPVPLRLPFDFSSTGSEGRLRTVSVLRARRRIYLSLNSESNTSTVVEINIQPYEIVLLGLCEKDGQRAKQVSDLIPGS